MFRSLFLAHLRCQDCVAASTALCVFLDKHTRFGYNRLATDAEVAESADALRSGRSARRGVGVRVSPSAQLGELPCFHARNGGHWASVSASYNRFITGVLKGQPNGAWAFVYAGAGGRV